MNDHLKQFATHSAYETAKNNIDKPNVVLCTQENEVHYNPYVDPFNGHAYVDLGLPSGTLWATMNVGAQSEGQIGTYYGYGHGADPYDSSEEIYKGKESPLDLSADTARQVWGGDWHMPTKEQIEELIDNTTYEPIPNYQGSDIHVGTFSANGQTLIIPVAGYCNSYGVIYGNSQGLILSSSLEDYKYYVSISTLYFDYNHTSLDL